MTNIPQEISSPHFILHRFIHSFIHSFAGDLSISTKSGITKVSTRCNLCNADDYELVTTGREHEYDNTTADDFNVVRCTKCGLIYLNPRPDVSELSTIYPVNYYSYNQKALRDQANPNSILHQLRYKGFQAKIRKSLSLCEHENESAEGKLAGGGSTGTRSTGSGATGSGSTESGSTGNRSPGRGAHPPRWSVLDIGCGDGHTLDLYARHPGVKTYGVDFNLVALELARSNGHTVYEGSFEKAELPSNLFDLVTATHVIEHVADPRQFLLKVHHVLRADGILWLETPNIGSMDATWFRARHWGAYHFPRHWFFFSRETLTKLAASAGFEPVFTDFVPNAIFWFWTFHSMLIEKFPRSRKFVDILLPPIDFQKDTFANFVRICFFCVIDVIIKKATGETSNMIMAFKKTEHADL
ncbi:MAG: class I SAM-dependent methyltransferase [Cyanobacteria bacterium SZAS-4]|nr:class I SAM-dependent methyltransferase [Cyanobacteria bacterium SZAS-4]